MHKKYEQFTSKLLAKLINESQRIFIFCIFPKHLSLTHFGTIKFCSFSYTVPLFLSPLMFIIKLIFSNYLRNPISKIFSIIEGNVLLCKKGYHLINLWSLSIMKFGENEIGEGIGSTRNHRVGIS
jgi:hypothetical protein